MNFAFLRPSRSLSVLALSFSLLTAISTPAGAAWQDDWKNTLQDVWSETKAKSQELYQEYKPKETVEIGIAYGTEKRKWLEWAVAEFANTEAGKRIKVKLIPMGSIEGGRAVLNGDRRIHVWAPASSLVESLLTDPWEREHEKSPILSDAPLALTPMVVVMWDDRYQAFMSKYEALNFKTIGEALQEVTGWAAIAGKPEWGPFTFGHTKPTHSNSGMLSLVLMAYDYWGEQRRIKANQVMDAGFLEWLESVEDYMNVDQSSTGKLMTQMLRFGPSELAGVMVYENLALSNLKTAEGRWGTIKVSYPTRSVWNDNPFYILDVPWSDEAHQKAAGAFQHFLLSPKAQRVARDKYLFRPANVDVPIVEPGSPFAKLEGVVQIDVPTIRRPKGKVLEQLLQVWKRMQ